MFEEREPSDEGVARGVGVIEAVQAYPPAPPRYPLWERPCLTMCSGARMPLRRELIEKHSPITPL